MCNSRPQNSGTPIYFTKISRLCLRPGLFGIFNAVGYRTSAFGFRQQMVNLDWLTRCIQLLQSRGTKLEICTYYRCGLSHWRLFRLKTYFTYSYDYFTQGVGCYPCPYCTQAVFVKIDRL